MVEIKDKNYSETDKDKSFAEFCELTVKTDLDGVTTEEEKEGVQIKGKDMLYLNAPNIFFPNNAPLDTEKRELYDILNELFQGGSGGGDDENDWRPPELPEPSDYEVCMLIEIVAPKTGTVDVGFSFYLNTLYKQTPDSDWALYNGIGPLTVDWGDGTVLSASGYDYDKWDNNNGTMVGDGWWLPAYGMINSHKYKEAGKYTVKFTSNEHSNFANVLMKEGSSGNVYTLAIKCGRKILVAQPIENTSFNEDLFSRLNSRLQYIKYAGESAGFTSFFGGYSLRKIETVEPYKEISIPLAKNVMQFCYNLKNFDFSECRKLYNVSLSYCGLKTLNLPKCTEINNANNTTTFVSNCIKLEEINAPVLKSTSNGLFSSCGALKKVNINACELVGRETFRNCTALSEVNLSSCISVELNAFFNCHSLKKIYLPECTSIGNYAFCNCSSLEEVYAPKCTSVGDYAFDTCGALQKTVFADGCTFGRSAFSGCHALYPQPI